MIILKKTRFNGKGGGISPDSGTALSQTLGVKVYTPKIKSKHQHSIILNWGLLDIPSWITSGTILNTPEAIKLGSNKLSAFKAFKEGGVDIVPFTTDKEDALKWIEEGSLVVCRTKLTGSSGEGIQIATTPEEVVNAPLYTKYIRKKYEFRCHVFDGKVIHTQQKRRLTSEELEARGIAERCKYIRNLNNGYIFSTNLEVMQTEIYSSLYHNSLLAIKSVGLDFGAVDLIVTKRGEVFVLEVNSCPGLEGTTLSKYSEEIKEKYGL